MHRRKIYLSTLFVLLFVSQFIWTSTVGAGPEPVVPAPTVQLTEAGVEVEWRLPPAPRGSATESWQHWSTVEIDGVEGPAYLLAFLLPDDEAEIEVVHLRTQPWAAVSPFQPVEEPARALPTGEVVEALPRAFAAAAPDQPVTLLRQGVIRGQRLGVVAILPLYMRGDDLQEVVELRFTIKHARPFGQDRPEVVAELWNQPWRLSADLPAPSPVTARTGVKITVERSGIQEISLAQLIDLGLVQSKAETNRLHLYFGQDPVALEEEPGGDVLRFYAPPPGDRWNRTSIYWLTLEQNPGLRMARQPALSANLTPDALQPWAWEEGEWYNPTLYESRHRGPDGDFWFSADLRAGAEIPTTAITLPLPVGLPPLSGSGVFTLTGTAYLSTNHALQLHPYRLSTSPPRQEPFTLTWSAQRDWSQSAAIPGDTYAVVASLQATGHANALWIDRLAWRRPVSLDFAGQGGHFSTSGEHTRYQLSTLPERFHLYDITDPRRPILIEAGQKEGALLLDSRGERRYLLASLSPQQIYLPLIASGGSTGRSLNIEAPVAQWVDRRSLHHRPRLSAHRPYHWQPALDADLLYIAPSEFIQSLAPLVEHRKQQGYQPAVVDVAAIYNGWSGGHDSPEAIRTFLRYAAAEGRQSPVAVTLVGDGTNDPRNYTNRNNTNFIPPYLASVDPWLGETACETCYAKLDEDDPRQDLLPDLLIGRIPAKSQRELENYLKKLLDYESEGSSSASSQVLYIADNYREADGTPDKAGDFTLSAEKSIALQPAGIEVKRIYYDPSPTHVDAPWRIPDALDAHKQTVAALDAGAGFANYIGHAHYWQWAHTDFNVEPSHLFGLYDVDSLTNRRNLSVVLSLTCLTAAFQTPAFSGTTLDERMLLHENGGAAAVWGPTGLGVAYGHDLLQRGFYEQYWSGDGERRMGALALSGYVTLFTQGFCCQDTINTYAILGDPIMAPQVKAVRQIYLPVVGGP
jgi:hypothetical protein